MTKAEEHARRKIAALTLRDLIRQWELVDRMAISVEVAMVRGWLMDELRKQDPEAFDRWIDSDDDDNVRHFFKIR